MFPKYRVAYKMTFPDGSTCYVAQVTALDPAGAQPPEDVPKGVYLYLMSSNTMLGGYAFRGSEAVPAPSNPERLIIRVYADGRFVERPLTLQEVRREQVEGDNSAPGDFGEDDLEDDSVIQNIIMAALSLPTMEINIEEKLQRGYVRVSS